MYPIAGNIGRQKLAKIPQKAFGGFLNLADFETTNPPNINPAILSAMRYIPFALFR